MLFDRVLMRDLQIQTWRPYWRSNRHSVSVYHKDHLSSTPTCAPTQKNSPCPKSMWSDSHLTVTQRRPCSQSYSSSSPCLLQLFPFSRKPNSSSAVGRSVIIICSSRRHRLGFAQEQGMAVSSPKHESHVYISDCRSNSQSIQSRIKLSVAVSQWYIVVHSPQAECLVK